MAWGSLLVGGNTWHYLGLTPSVTLRNHLWQTQETIRYAGDTSRVRHLQSKLLCPLQYLWPSIHSD